MQTDDPEAPTTIDERFEYSTSLAVTSPVQLFRRGIIVSFDLRNPSTTDLIPVSYAADAAGDPA